MVRKGGVSTRVWNRLPETPLVRHFSTGCKSGGWFFIFFFLFIYFFFFFIFFFLFFCFLFFIFFFLLPLLFLPFFFFPLHLLPRLFLCFYYFLFQFSALPVGVSLRPLSPTSIGDIRLIFFFAFSRNAFPCFMDFIFPAAVFLPARLHHSRPWILDRAALFPSLVPV